MNLGQVYTKRQVADFMVKMFSLPDGAKVLDPCFGHGVFVESLLEHTKYRIDGVEIDQHSFSLFDNPDARSCHLRNCDFFDIEESYDGIIMNPPYVRHEELDHLKPLGLTKQKLQSVCGLMTISRKANLYMYFILHAIMLLREGGELIAIFPNAWTNTPIGKQFNEQMKLFGHIVDYIDVEGEAFEGSPMVDVCILKFVRGKQGETTRQLMRIDANNAISLENVKEMEVKAAASLTRLQKTAHVRRGITTGANHIFVNPPLFTQDHQTFILSSPKDFSGYTTLHSKQDKLLTIREGDSLNEEESTYIENSGQTILKSGKPQTLKALIDKGQPWYYIPLPKKAQIVFSYIVRNSLKFALNEGQCHVRDNFYMISSLHDPLLLMALLNNYHVYSQLERTGKSYGKGLLKLQKYDIDDVKIPHPSALSQHDENTLVRLSKELIETSHESRIEAITHVLDAYYESEGAKEEYLKMKAKRLTHDEQQNC